MSHVDLRILTMLIDAQQQTLVRDGIPPQGWKLRMVRIWHPDLNLTTDKNIQTNIIRFDLLFVVCLGSFSDVEQQGSR